MLQSIQLSPRTRTRQGGRRLVIPPFASLALHVTEVYRHGESKSERELASLLSLGLVIDRELLPTCPLPAGRRRERHRGEKISGDREKISL